MRHLVPSTNYEGYNGRVQLNTAAICSRARLSNQERGINKAGAAGSHADPDQLCLCQYGAMNRMFPTRMQRQEERGGKHVGTKIERTKNREWVTVRKLEMSMGKLLREKKKFCQLELAIGTISIDLKMLCSNAIFLHVMPKTNRWFLWRYHWISAEKKTGQKQPCWTRNIDLKMENNVLVRSIISPGFLKIQSVQSMSEQTKEKNKQAKTPTHNQPEHRDKHTME